MQAISLSQAMPYILGLAGLLLGVISYFVRRYVEANDKEHEQIRTTLQVITDHLSQSNNNQHAELYERLRNVEITLSAIKAQHDQNHD